MLRSGNGEWQLAMIGLIAHSLLQPHNIKNSHRRIKILIAFVLQVNFSQHIHSLYHFSKCGITLFVGNVFSAIIQARLFAYADKKSIEAVPEVVRANDSMPSVCRIFFCCVVS